jgi:hypothetical protein
MNIREVIKTALTNSQSLLDMFLGDLSDADLLVRPIPEANHPAWQLGHLIGGEVHLLSQTLPGVRYPELPAGFIEQHDKATAATEPSRGFLTRDQYLALAKSVNQATLKAVEGLTEADLDRPIQGPIAEVAPTLGALLLLVATHAAMHAGQFTVVRRKLGKPVLF